MRIFLCAIIITFPLFIFILTTDFDVEMKLILSFFVFVICLNILAFYVRLKEKVMEKQVKQEIVPQLVKFMHPDFNYAADKYMDERDFEDALVFKSTPDRYYGDDLIYGCVHDEAEQSSTNVSFSEIDASMDGKRNINFWINKYYRAESFKGLFFKVDFNKDLGGAVTIITPRSMIDTSGYRKREKMFLGSPSLAEVHLENPAFMEHFIVHSNDQINARVILQANTMEGLLKFIEPRPDTISRKRTSGLNRGTPIFTFRENRIYLLIETGSRHFNVRLLEKTTIDTVYEYFLDINRVLRLMDDLHLNLKMYVK